MHSINRIIKQLIFFCLALIASTASYAVDEVIISGDATFEALTSQLTQGSYSDRGKVIELLAKIEDQRILVTFQKMLKSKLYFVKESKQLGFITKAEDAYRLTSILNADLIGLFKKNKIKKVKVNNKLRRLLGGYIAQLSLKSDDDSVRKSAVKKILQNINEKSIFILQELDKTENSVSIKELIAEGVFIWNLNSENKEVKLKAIKALSSSLMPKVKVTLENIIASSADVKIKRAALKSLKNINSKISYFGFLENLVFGLSLGSVLLLIAVGLAITFGVMGVINMAHGELMMLGAYTTYVVQQILPDHIAASIFISIPLAFLVAGAFGVAIERFVIRYLYGRPLETLLATFGVSLILQQLVRSIFGPTNQAVETPAFMSGSLEINSIFAITYNRLYIFIFAIVVLLLLMLILKKTRLGLQVRAVSQNRTMAKAMGIKSEWVDAMTFGLGSGIAGVAGVALSQLTNVGPNLGQGYIIDSFMVVVFGGVGNLLGTFVGAMSLGLFNKFLEPWSGAVLAKIFVLVFIILFIQKRPRGLFPKKGRGVED